ncbi:protein Daple-like [Impatiens glandulifera]|uniref:protein Daple-like n=1 Tax=Impatiens glandulifera TaxID=253017 RepID=UPI001FB08422|nr:protein Daple-like [Impatiens glandulifera]
MSRLNKSKFEKEKLKVVFRLQFHATHVLQAGWDKLFIYFIPVDSGKPKAKTTKVNVRNGQCKWADPIYETTRLIQNSKSKQYDEKIYKFVVAMGSSRSSILGEATINLADYANAFKPVVIPLPLDGCNCGAVLYVTIQLLNSKTGFREFEQQSEIRETGLQNNDLTEHDTLCYGNVSTSETPMIHQDHANVRIGSELEDLVSHEEEAEEICSSAKNTAIEVADSFNHLILDEERNDWMDKWDSEYSSNSDPLPVIKDNGRHRYELEESESVFLQQLKMEVSSLQMYADEISNEGQRFSQLLIAEISSVEELANEISLVKLEFSQLKGRIEMDSQYSLRNGLNLDFITQEQDTLDATGFLKGKIFDLLKELDEVKSDRETLRRRMDQMEFYYETLIQELEENQKKIIGEFMTLRNEHSGCLHDIASTKAEMESMQHCFNDEYLKLDSINKELNKKAANSEAALIRAHLNYSRNEVDAKFNDKFHKNQFLETEVERLSKENRFLCEKINEYEDLLSEKMELERLLDLETLKNNDLQGEIRSLRDEFRISKNEHDKFTEKLRSVLVFYNRQFNQYFPSDDIRQDYDSIIQLENFLSNVYEGFYHLSEEKKRILDDKESEITIMREVFKDEINDLFHKLHTSDALFDKFQLKMDTLEERLQIEICTESELQQRYVNQNKEILDNLEHFRIDLQQLTSENMELAAEILELGSLSEELDRCKMIMSKLAQEIQNLRMDLKSKNEEYVKLESEVERLNQYKLEESIFEEAMDRVLLQNEESETTVLILKSRLEELHEHVILSREGEKGKMILLEKKCNELNQKLSEQTVKAEEFRNLSIHLKAIIDSSERKPEGRSSLRVVFMKEQYETKIEELNQQLLKLQKAINGKETLVNISGNSL